VDTQWDFHNGPITADGKRTEVYDRIREVNREIKKLSKVFLGARVLSVTHTGNTIPAGTKPLAQLPDPIKMLKTEGKGAVVSVLENGDKNYLVIVNRDFLSPMKLTLECNPEVKRILKDGSDVPVSAYAATQVVDPGDAAIYSWRKINRATKKISIR
jgi:hypothetical protein